MNLISVLYIMLVYVVILGNVDWNKLVLNYKHFKIDREVNLLNENNIRGGISSVMRDRFVISDENKRILYIDSNNLYGHSMS